MFKFIDSDDINDLEGFAYQGRFGVEYVELGGDQLTIKDSEGDEANIAYEDLPKLIKALQAVYDHKG